MIKSFSYIISKPAAISAFVAFYFCLQMKIKLPTHKNIPVCYLPILNHFKDNFIYFEENKKTMIRIN